MNILLTISISAFLLVCALKYLVDLLAHISRYRKVRRLSPVVSWGRVWKATQ